MGPFSWTGDEVSGNRRHRVRVLAGVKAGLLLMRDTYAGESEMQGQN